MDPVANMLITIKNGYMAKKTAVSVPHSKFKMEIARVLEKENFVGKVTKGDKTVDIELLYQSNKPNLTEVKKVSKLGLRHYSGPKHLKSVKGGRGIQIISTSKGVMSDKEAKKIKVGGEVICQVW